MTFLYMKSSMFHTVLPDSEKVNMMTPQFFCPLNKICLILQNNLNLEKLKYFQTQKLTF